MKREKRRRKRFSCCSVRSPARQEAEQQQQRAAVAPPGASSQREMWQYGRVPPTGSSIWRFDPDGIFSPLSSPHSAQADGSVPCPSPTAVNKRRRGRYRAQSVTSIGSHRVVPFSLVERRRKHAPVCLKPKSLACPHVSSESYLFGPSLKTDYSFWPFRHFGFDIFLFPLCRPSRLFSLRGIKRPIFLLFLFCPPADSRDSSVEINLVRRVCVCVCLILGWHRNRDIRWRAVSLWMTHTRGGCTETGRSRAGKGWQLVWGFRGTLSVLTLCEFLEKPEVESWFLNFWPFHWFKAQS